MSDQLMKRYEFPDFADWAGTVNEVTAYPGFLLVFDEETIVAAVPYAL